MPGWHTIIRGLAPQAGGFRRRSNKPSSVGLSAWLIVVNERLPCVLQVVAATCSSVSYLNTCQTCNPGSDPVASHAQYITNRIHGNAFGGKISLRGRQLVRPALRGHPRHVFAARAVARACYRRSAKTHRAREDALVRLSPPPLAVNKRADNRLTCDPTPLCLQVADQNPLVFSGVNVPVAVTNAPNDRVC